MKKGFTLAEVLITLVIIGVVAALTIPTLTQNTQDKELITRMKKAYSVLAQAYSMIRADNSGNFVDALSDCPSAASDRPASGNCLRDVFKSKIKYIKECDAPNSYGNGNCFVATNRVKLYSGNIQGTNYYLDPANRASIITNDGMVFGFYSQDTNCDTDYILPQNCGGVTVDVNGNKGPNQFGKDFYAFAIHSHFFRPLCPLTGRCDRLC